MKKMRSGKIVPHGFRTSKYILFLYENLFCMLSKKTRYAMLALASLAREYGKGVVPIGRIAAEEKIPQRFLEGILLQMKNRGWLGSVRGKSGGYFLNIRPEDISLEEIVTEFEGSVCLIACLCDKMQRPCEFCKDEAACRIRHTFEKIYRDTLTTLRTSTLQSLIGG